GEGVQGLARAFLHAGSNSVVASLWNVNDARTADLMTSFYRHLAQSESKGEALRNAKLEMLQSAGSASPTLWAPFILIGDAVQPISISGLPWWVRYGRILGFCSLVAALALLASIVRTPAK